MATIIYLVYRCLRCGWCLETRNGSSDYKCAACNSKMSFITTVKK